MSKNYEDDIPWDDDNPFEEPGAQPAPPPAAPKASAEPAISRPARGAFSSRAAGGESADASRPIPEEPAQMVPPAPRPTPVAPAPAASAAAAAAVAPTAHLRAAAGSGYAENYQKLRRAAQALREQNEPDLDALIPLVDDAVAAYKNCKARIDQVKALLGERLEQLEDGAQKPAGQNGAR